MLDASVNEFRDLLLTTLVVIGIIFDTSVSDLCHCVTPKVVGCFKSVPLVVCVPITSFFSVSSHHLNKLMLIKSAEIFLFHDVLDNILSIITTESSSQ